MKIGIHHIEGSFSDSWIAYCDSKGIEYRLVDCYQSDIIEQLSDCGGLMWHYNHKGPKESKFAKQLLFSVESKGMAVFPNFHTSWHFDDKVGQKYLLEAIGAPFVPSYTFYSKQEALAWVSHASYPIVFKLRNGAGSDNVKLVNSRRKASKLIWRAFGPGFRQYNSWDNFLERIRKYRVGKTNFFDVLKGGIRLFHPTKYARVTGRERGYIYFQEFIPGNDHDIRVIVIGNKAFAIKRMVRKNDFRASGSGFIHYEKDNFNNETIRIAFDISKMLNCQCMAYDFVYQAEQPLVVEISYGFDKSGYDRCVGFWDEDLNWFEGEFSPYEWMVDDLIKMGGR